MFKKITDLSCSPWNDLIYGEEDLDNDFIKSIKKNGIKEPIVITKAGTIISGNQRLKAARELGLDQVPVRIEEYESDIEEREAVIEYNRYRDKTFSQKMREAEFVEETERIKAKKRQATSASGIYGGKPLVDTCPEPVLGRSRDQIAQKTGVGSGRTYDRAKKIWDTAKQGDKEAQKTVKKIDKRDVSISNAYQQVRRKEKEAKREERRKQNTELVSEKNIFDTIHDVDAKFATIMIDPPWDWGDEGDVDQLGRARPTYHTLSYNELLNLPVDKIADVDCHLYLWITNRSLPKGFQLINQWGFRYITCITWVKPSFGMGNYFRGSTEHILFGIKGSQPLKRKDAATHFTAKRGERGHSSKPVEAYKLIETCSPGPYVELFSRGDRHGWISIGAEI